MCAIHQKLTSFVLYPVQRCTRHFSSDENTVTGITYPDMVSEWLLPQMQQDGDNFTFIQDGAPPHWHNEVRHYLDENLPRRWIGRSTVENLALACWPPRSPCDFFLWGYIRDRVFVPPLPVSLNELKQRITTAVASVDKDMSQVCLDRIRQSYWYLSCDKRLTHRTFVTSSYKLKNMYCKTM